MRMELKAHGLGYMHERRVLRNIDLSLRDNEFFVIMGANGSGKSTLLKILAGLVTPTEGRVELIPEGGSPMAMHSILDRGVVQSAFVFETGGLVSNLSAFDNVALPLRYREGAVESDVCRRVRETLHALDLSDCASTRPTGLSPGLRIRVQIARAQVMEPCIVFYDSPEFGLDAHQNHLVQDAISKLHKEQGCLSVLATGSARWPRRMADRAAVLRDGGLAAQGTMEELSRSKDQSLREFLED